MSRTWSTGRTQGRRTPLSGVQSILHRDHQAWPKITVRPLRKIEAKDLMARMGHDDMRAALIYQRATSEADRRIADRLSALVDGQESAGNGQDDDEDGAAGVLLPAR
jgi:hypothetical protein